MADVGNVNDDPPPTDTTRRIRLDTLVNYHYDQIQRTADTIKDDLETIRKRFMVPDLPKLVNNTAESEKLAKAILNQFGAVVHKCIDVMSKLDEDLKVQMYDRFPAVSPPNVATQSELPAVSPSPPSSTTPEPELEQEDGPVSVDSTMVSDTVANVNELEAGTIPETHTDTENDEVVVVTKSNPNSATVNTNGLDTLCTDNLTVTTAALTVSVVDPCNDHEKLDLPEQTIVLQQENDAGTAKESTSEATETNEGSIKGTRGDVTETPEEIEHDAVVRDGTSDPVMVNSPPTSPASQESPTTATTTGNKTDTDGDQEEDDIPELLKCPKLAQISKVVVARLTPEIHTQYRELKGKTKKGSWLDQLEKELDRGLKTRVPKVSETETRRGSRPTLPRKAKNKDASKSDDDEVGLDGSDEEGSSSGSESSEVELPKRVIPAVILESDDDNEDGSGVDLELGDSEDEPLANKRKKETKPQSQKDDKSSPKKRYITPKLSMKIFSSSESDSEAGTSKKKPVKQKTANVSDDSKGKDSSEEITMKRENNESDGGKSIGSSGTSTRKSEDSDSDLQFIGRVRRDPGGKALTKILSDTESDHGQKEGLPLTKKKYIDLKKLAETIKSICDSESGSETGTPKKDEKNRKKRAKSKSGSESEDNENTTKRAKKRRRVKNEVLSESNDSDVVVLESNVSKSPIKGMRKVMSKSELKKTTRQAGKDEEDRKRRVAEIQKQYNELFSGSMAAGETVKELVLDFDRQTKKPLVSVDPSIVKHLKPHQVHGIKFMWDNCYESVEAIEKDKGDGGCILAHCMGLGKTLQGVGFLHTVMTHKVCKTRRALVICPLNTVGNWLQEFQHWCVDCDVRPRVHTLWDSKGKRRFEALSDWERLGGVAILHYESFRMLTGLADKKGKGKPSPRELQIVKSSLHDPGPDIVICDEGHLLKNASTKQAQSVMKLRTTRRIVLTGTPLQNDLMEYFTMMSFVKPNLLGTKHEFRNRFVNPIERGQHKGSTEHQVMLMKRRAHVLHKLLDGCVQRLDYTVLMPYLPPKYEYAISINMSQIQKDLYQYYINNISAKSQGSQLNRRLLPDYSALVKVWTHPIVLTFKGNRRSGSDDSDEDSLKDFICDDETTTTASESEKTPRVEPADSDLEIIDQSGGTGKGKEGGEEPDPVPKNWYSTILKSQNLDNPELGGKIVVLIEILKTCARIGDRVLVFSQFLGSLDLIESILAHMDSSGDENLGRWRPNIEYFRIDGSVGTDEREKSCKTFNQDRTSQAKLFLISTRAGGLGINLPGANRVVIFDASWNPSQDIQSIFRVYRFGQTKPCYVYRLLARGTMEEKIYNRQVVKLSLSCRVVDEQQIERHFQYDEVQAMYDFNLNDTTERPTPVPPKDRLLRDLLLSHEKWIFSYLEHDSLLENKEEEELTEEDRRAAWEDYKNEDVPKPHVDAWTQRLVLELKRKYPEKLDAEVFQIVHNCRMKFHEMETYLTIINSSQCTTEQKELSGKKLRDTATGLKLIFGDDTDWTGLFNNRPIPKPAQQRVTKPHQYQPPHPQNVRPIPSTSTSTIPATIPFRPPTSSTSSFGRMDPTGLEARAMTFQPTAAQPFNSGGSYDTAVKNMQSLIQQYRNVPGFVSTTAQPGGMAPPVPTSTIRYAGGQGMRPDLNWTPSPIPYPQSPLPVISNPRTLYPTSTPSLRPNLNSAPAPHPGLYGVGPRTRGGPSKWKPKPAESILPDLD